MKIKLSWEVEACISVQIKFCFMLKEEQGGCGNGGEGGSKGKGENYGFPSCFLFMKDINVHSTNINRVKILKYYGKK